MDFGIKCNIHPEENVTHFCLICFKPLCHICMKDTSCEGHGPFYMIDDAFSRFILPTLRLHNDMLEKHKQTIREKLESVIQKKTSLMEESSVSSEDLKWDPDFAADEKKELLLSAYICGEINLYDRLESIANSISQCQRALTSPEDALLDKTVLAASTSLSHRLYSTRFHTPLPSERAAGISVTDSMSNALEHFLHHDDVLSAPVLSSQRVRLGRLIVSPKARYNKFIRSGFPYFGFYDKCSRCVITVEKEDKHTNPVTYTDIHDHTTWRGDKTENNVRVVLRSLFEQKTAKKEWDEEMATCCTEMAKMRHQLEKKQKKEKKSSKSKPPEVLPKAIPQRRQEKILYYCDSPLHARVFTYTFIRQQSRQKTKETKVDVASKGSTPSLSTPDLSYPKLPLPFPCVCYSAPLADIWTHGASALTPCLSPAPFSFEPTSYTIHDESGVVVFSGGARGYAVLFDFTSCLFNRVHVWGGEKSIGDTSGPAVPPPTTRMVLPVRMMIPRSLDPDIQALVPHDCVVVAHSFMPAHTLRVTAPYDVREVKKFRSPYMSDVCFVGRLKMPSSCSEPTPTGEDGSDGPVVVEQSHVPTFIEGVSLNTWSGQEWEKEMSCAAEIEREVLGDEHVRFHGDTLYPVGSDIVTYDSHLHEEYLHYPANNLFFNICKDIYLFYDVSNGWCVARFSV
ncbi:hypothetical protein ADUPG1_010415 [Aduncisulcus paluster]|uniref:B box-type domain-containing protein n=1 Tax=Aduncisulcus paluster TaxID=2918883 RepID=A0ABQ5JRZ1_9EUKA|nr:hypothetical protein ADUPG1_010415 [Aduncisulcus paluster]